MVPHSMIVDKTDKTKYITILFIPFIVFSIFGCSFAKRSGAGSMTEA
jgi:hypothetical protein